MASDAGVKQLIWEGTLSRSCHGCGSHRFESKHKEQNAESPQLPGVLIPTLNRGHYRISSLRGCGWRREGGAGRGGGKNKNKPKEISIFSNLSACTETPRRPFLSKSCKLESAARGGNSAVKTHLQHPSRGSRVGRSCKSPTGNTNLPGEGCSNQQPSSPCLPLQAPQVKQQREKLAGRRAVHASWNQPLLSEPIFYPTAPLEISADTTDITTTSTLAILHLNGLSPLYPSTSGAKSLPPDLGAALWDGPNQDRQVIPNPQGEKDWISSPWQ